MKRLLAALLAGVTAVGLSACASAPDSAPAAEPVETAVMQDTAVYGDAKNPKYVFLFIGDGMSYPQFQAAADYLGAMADPDYTARLDSLRGAGVKLARPQAARPAVFYFTARPSAGTREVTVVATDRFGRRYTEQVRLR